MARTLLQPALRPYLPADAPLLAAIFRAAIEDLTAEDYSEAQQAAWALLAEDEAAFGQRLAASLTLVATVEGSPVGFISLKGADHIDMLYVHPAVAREGIGSLLCDAIEKLAAARGTKHLTTDASDTARPLFEKRGFTPRHRNTIPLGDEWLGNTRMEKDLSNAQARH
jgi:putative acetyltransferase